MILRRRNTKYKIPQLVAQHEQICCATSSEFDEKRATKPKFFAQSSPALYFSQQPATNVFVVRQVDHVRRKTRNIDQNLQRNHVARQVKGFCIVFRRLYSLLNTTTGFTWRKRFSSRAHDLQEWSLSLQSRGVVARPSATFVG